MYNFKGQYDKRTFNVFGFSIRESRFQQVSKTGNWYIDVYDDKDVKIMFTGTYINIGYFLADMIDNDFINNFK